jgi:hypothetical protein
MLQVNLRVEVATDLVRGRVAMVTTPQRPVVCPELDTGERHYPASLALFISFEAKSSGIWKVKCPTSADGSGPL